MDVNALVAALLGIFYGLNEVYISIKKYSSSSKDGGTFTYLWIVITCSMIFSTQAIRRGYGLVLIENPSWRYFLVIPVGVSIFLMGYILRRQAIEQLGQWFTTPIRTVDNQQLIDVGWYSKMRHPSYTGVLMCFLGLSVLLNNLLSLFGIMLPICSVFLYRIYVEEQVLEKHFGSKYRDYRQRVPNKIIPKMF